MINRIIDITLDVLVVALLWFLAPILIALCSSGMPVYARVTGVIFLMLISGAVFYRLRLNLNVCRNAHRGI
jgi:hypothetical protein